MRPLPLYNPQNRFVSTATDYDDGEAPNVDLEVFEDHTRNILATNDSPDVGFRWSVNPYRGCQHGCAFCLDGNTPILMGDGSTRALRDVRVGDVIYGTKRDGRLRRYARTTVRAHWQTLKAAYRIVLADGTELIASGDHRFLSERGFAYVTAGAGGRPYLAPGDSLVGTGAFVATLPTSTEYKRGYLAVLLRADDLPRLELDVLRRTRAFLFDEDVRATALRVGSSTPEITPWPASPTREWRRGFLAGVFDTAGSRPHGDSATARVVRESLADFGFAPGCKKLDRGLREHLRFVHVVAPASRRRIDLEGTRPSAGGPLHIERIEELRIHLAMFDITTGTGDFIANGVVSHNCFARPSHEYLSFGAGTDFDRKIVVKPRAAELLREAFDKKSWKGELVVFSGVTDCYQPLERTMMLTRGCLEVCAQYKNPIGIITKSPVVERDVDVLQQLTRDAAARVSVSIPFWDHDAHKAMEPYVTTPQRRMKTVETLAKAGIRVGVSVAPIVPGLNDDHLGDLLQAAANAGATYAFFTLLRLPGAVKDVFEKALREKLPLRADKVLRRMREAHGGKLYDSTYGVRQRGNGEYARTIEALFDRTAKRYGLHADAEETFAAPSTFRRPDRSGQTSFGF